MDAPTGCFTGGHLFKIVAFEIILIYKEMDKYSYYQWFITVYHAVNCLAAYMLTLFLIYNKKSLWWGDRGAILLSSFILFESLNFLWIVKAADDLFKIRNQGLQIAWCHLIFIGPIFVVASLMGFFAAERRVLCLAFCSSYVICGVLAYFIS